MTVYNYYDVGDLVHITADFTNQAGSPTDPTAVICKIKTPGGTVTTYTYGTDPEIVKDSVGSYHLDHIATQEGTYKYRWEGTGAVQAAEDGRFYVDDSDFI